jgi:hypothetical protein
MNPSPATDGRTFRLADLAFGSQTHVVDASRPLAWLSPEELDIDLSDPVQRRFGDYELLEKIGMGGMGVVYRARQHGLDRDVALKLLAAGPWASDEFVERFRREARSAARMQHPNIVEIYEFGHREGLNYFSMRLIDGESLAQRLAKTAAMPARAAAALLRTLAEAMDYAHRLGVLHLDLKPANVLLTSEGTPLIADFGLARRIDAGHEGNAEISGTPSYMAPEQAQLESHPLSACTDIYGLGAVLYECLTGRAPFLGGDSQAVLTRVVSEAPPNPRVLRPEIPPDLEAICLKCLEKDPSQRYPSARAMADDLGRFIEGRPVSVRPLGAWQRARRWCRREPRLALALAVAAAALVVGVAATTWPWRQAVAQRNSAEAAERSAGVERDRAKTAGEIGAWLYAHGGESEDEETRARGLIAWLRQRWPGDEQRQADALSEFAANVSAEQALAADQLLAAIVRVLGADYRAQVIHSLEGGQDPYRDLYAAMLSWSDIEGESHTQEFDARLRSAMQAHPNDELALQVASVYCPNGKCAFPQAPAGLVRVAPDNMYAWLLLAISTADEAARRNALHEAAQRERVDDYFARDYHAYEQAVKVAAVPVPPLLARPIAALAPNDPPQLSIAINEAHRFPIASWQPLVRTCLPADIAALEPQLRKDCLVIGERMARSRGGLMVKMIGVALVRNLAKGTALAEEMKQIRAHYEYLGSVDDTLSEKQRSSYPSSRYMQDLSTVGELAAMQRRAEYFGLPGTPPAGWKPDDPTRLLSSREWLDGLVAVHEDGRRRLARGDFAGAISVLAPVEEDSRKHLRFRQTWRFPRYLVTLGNAHAGLGEFDVAEKYLLEAWQIVQGFGPSSAEGRDCASALLALYQAKYAAHPDNATEAKLSEWQALRAEYEE